MRRLTDSVKSRDHNDIVEAVFKLVQKQNIKASNIISIQEKDIELSDLPASCNNEILIPSTQIIIWEL
jgi:hypothetical protein